MMPRIARARTGLLPLASAVLIGCSATGQAQTTLPARYDDATFWRLSADLSEPNGYFRSDNLLSNETSYQWVVPTLQKMTRPDGVYLGVAPEQNFTFIAALRPKVAFIIDIRRGNLLEHLLYKALFEMNDNRVDFAFHLFGRRRPAGIAPSIGVVDLFARIGTTPPDTGFARGVLNDVQHRLTATHGFPLTSEDMDYIAYVYGTFSSAGPGVRYNMGGYGGGFRGGFGRGMPNYNDLMTESDSLGVHRSYLATDEAYGVIRDMEERNAIVPFTGDFAGPKALRAFGQYVRDHGGVVQAIYVSNVEQYLFQDVDNWRRYYENVATLPIDSTTVFIRSATQGYNRQQSVNSRQNELLCPVQAHLKGFREGRIQQYWDVFSYCR
ncbi:MAG TPA: hypothetical protein VG916_14880 [Gemmatimonadaceae bacterium]|nr:hypothetical protein [Gemmatimonadaceae bacterium]